MSYLSFTARRHPPYRSLRVAPQYSASVSSNFCVSSGEELTSCIEGIGLVIPITDAMKEPKKFPKVLSGVVVSLICEWQMLCYWMIGVNCYVIVTAVLFGGAGALGYLTFGDKIQTVVLVNLNPNSKMVLGVSPSRVEGCVCVFQFNCVIGAIPIFPRDPIVHPSPIVPGRQDHGERHLHPEWEAEPHRQMAEERVPFLHRRALHNYQLDRGQGLGQVCIAGRQFCLVSSPLYRRPRTRSDVWNEVFPSAWSTPQCCITKLVRARGGKRPQISHWRCSACWPRRTLPCRHLRCGHTLWRCPPIAD